MVKKPTSSPSSDNAQPIEWFEHMRLRPEMYVGRIGDGSDSRDGVYFFIRSILNTYVIEYKMSFGNHLVVDVADDRITIREFGRGIPFESIVDKAQYGMHSAMGCDTPDWYLLEYAFASASSIEFYVASFRDGVRFWARFSKGHLVERGSNDTSEENGTFFRITPDEEVFHTSRFQDDIVRDIFQSVVHQNKELGIILNGAIVTDSF